MSRLRRHRKLSRSFNFGSWVWYLSFRKYIEVDVSTCMCEHKTIEYCQA